MKVSEFLRQYQLTGIVPEERDPVVAIWAGWLTGHAIVNRSVDVPAPQAIELSIETAIRAAEAIEERARG